MQKMNCPILGRDTEVDRTGYGQAEWPIVRCRETGFVYLENPPDYSKLESEFAWESTSQEERVRRETRVPWIARVSAMAKWAKGYLYPTRNKTASMALASIVAKRRSNLTVLDVGCACGDLLRHLYYQSARAGVTLESVGIEVSRAQAMAAKTELSAIGGQVIFANALEGIDSLKENSIDLVIMCSFLEHECRPLFCLKGLHHVLASDGEVIVKVPNFSSWNRRFRGNQWPGFRFPDHVNYFTPKTLKRLAHEAGFQMTRQNILDRFPLSDNMYASFRKCPKTVY
jgi:2-polyprenyl-3-methyl-5-hydroxy-6-metoxy-1,4-benzoquinol methylase